MKSQLLLLALLCVATAASAEQVYKWTDASGVVHYSDAPPPKDTQNVTTVRVSGGVQHAVQPDAAATPEGGAKPADAGNGNPGGTPVASTSPGGDQKQKNCEQARQNLSTLNSNQPVAVNGPDGKPQPLDDKGRQAQVAEANKQIAYFCN